MALADALPFSLPIAQALVLGAMVAFLGTLVAMPRIIQKLRGAGIVGHDINKPGRPEVAEMGGIGVFLGFYGGVFAVLVSYDVPLADQTVILIALITAAGAAMTGVMDDLIELRQRFKGFIPLVFAAPLAVYLDDYTIVFPWTGPIDFGLVYPVLLVPLGIACAANSFNMLEGYNGLGAGVGLVMSAALAVMVWLEGTHAALVLLLPLAGALAAFLVFNVYPAKAFPGDTMTLLVGAVLAAAAMVGKVEAWGALLFLPHIAEFWLKARGHFEAENFAKHVEARPGKAPLLAYTGRIESLTHLVLFRRRLTEPAISAAFWIGQALLSSVIVAAYVITR